MMESSFNCHQCEDTSCTLSLTEMPHCTTAMNCFISVIRKSKDIIHYTRGCVISPQHNRDICNDVSQAEHADFSYRCCNEEFCNNGSFPMIDPYTESQFDWRYIILCITLFVIIIVAAVVTVSLYTLYKVYKRFGRQEQQIREEMIEMNTMRRRSSV